MMAVEFLKLLPYFLRLFGSKDQHVSNIELLVKYEHHYSDKDELARQVQSHVNAKLYGKGQVIPSEYLALARSSKNPELILALFSDVSNFLSYPSGGGVVLRRDLKSNKKLNDFKKVIDTNSTIGFISIILFIYTIFFKWDFQLINIILNKDNLVLKLYEFLSIHKSVWLFLAGLSLTVIFSRINQKLQSLKQLISSTQLETDA